MVDGERRLEGPEERLTSDGFSLPIGTSMEVQHEPREVPVEGPSTNATFDPAWWKQILV